VFEARGGNDARTDRLHLDNAMLGQFITGFASRSFVVALLTIANTLHADILGISSGSYGPRIPSLRRRDSPSRGDGANMEAWAWSGSSLSCLP
jgi:hypothetical protein